MLRPALRTSHRFFCGASSTISTTLPGRAEIAHQFGERLQLARQRRVSSPENSTSRMAAGRPISARLDGRAEAGLAGQLDHDAVDQLDRAGAQLDDMLGGVHRGLKAGEIDHAQHPMRAAAAPASASGAW